jgi:hypothetical protein
MSLETGPREEGILNGRGEVANLGIGIGGKCTEINVLELERIIKTIT